jgi:hypothetical protein
VTFRPASVNLLSRMNKASKYFWESYDLSLQLVREQLVPVLILFAISTALNVTVEDSLQALSRTDESQRWVLQLTMGVWDILESIVMILILSWGIPKIRPLTEAHFQKDPFGEPYISSFLAEYLLLLAVVLAFGLLLIIPGFLAYCLLVFVPFVTLFARPYRQGRYNALKLAFQLTRGWRLVIIGLELVTALLQLLMEFLPQLVPWLHVLPVRILFSGAGFFISIWLYSVLYLLFEQAMEEYKWN